MRQTNYGTCACYGRTSIIGKLLRKISGRKKKGFKPINIGRGHFKGSQRYLRD